MVEFTRQITTWEQIQGLRAEIQVSGFYLKISGGLGNQLFGLSETVRIARIQSGIPFIEFSNSQHSNQNDHEKLLNFMRANFRFILIINSTEFSIFAGRELTNLATANKNEIENSIAFIGWAPTLQSIELSGLFVQGCFPFSRNSKSLPPKSVAIHMRLGDYKLNTHLGVVARRYYKSVVNNLRKEDSSLNFFLFSDNPEEALSRLGAVKNNILVVDNELSPLETLHLMSTASNLIAANSTFSFWAYFFSNSRTFVPFPFYISDWRWDNELWGNRVIRVNQHFFLFWLKLKFWCSKNYLKL